MSTRIGNPWAVRSGAALALVWLVVPLSPLVIWAVADVWTYPEALPQDWGLRGWRDAWGSGLGPALLRSSALGLGVAVIATPVGAMAGRTLGWRLTRHPRALISIMLLPLLLPPFAVAMGLDVVVLRIGVPSTVAVLAVLAVFALPYTTAVCAAGYARCSPSLEEQARALGASARTARWRVVLPTVRPSLLVAALLAFLVGWSDYVVTLLLGGGRLITAPVLLGSAANGTGNQPAVAAVGLATAVPPMVLLLVLGRQRLRAGVRS